MQSSNSLLGVARGTISAAESMSKSYYYRAEYPFRGDPQKGQISFGVGTILLAHCPLDQHQKGYVKACLLARQNSEGIVVAACDNAENVLKEGWCPYGHLVLLKVAQETTATASSTPVVVVPDAVPVLSVNNNNNKNGFSSSSSSAPDRIPMAMAIPVYRVKIDATDTGANHTRNNNWFTGSSSGATTQSQQQQQQQRPNFAGMQQRFGSSLRAVGSSISESATKATEVAVSSAKAATAGIKSGMNHNNATLPNNRNNTTTTTGQPLIHASSATATTATSDTSPWSDANDCVDGGTTRRRATFHSQSDFHHQPQLAQAQQLPGFEGMQQRFGTSLRSVGSTLSESATKAKEVAVSGAKAASEGMQHIATQTQQQFADAKQTPKHQRTANQQRAINAGNCAARSAVAGGVVNGIFHGPKAVVRGATEGAIIGGTYGALKGWKPFG